MKSNKLNFLFFLFLILFLCFSSIFFVTANDVEKRGLEVSYPPINGIEITDASTIEDYAVYLFSIAMIIGAVLAFAVLIYGGFRYITSSGDPSAMGDAKKWILEAILGLILLLCSWFIIGVINERILNPKIPEVEASSGIYLVDKNGEKIPYTQDFVYNIPDYFEIDHIEFISDKPTNLSYADPNKDELYSVFIYDEKDLKGKPEEIINGGASTTQPVNKIGSMFLLWWKPGAYFYDEVDFGTNLYYPRFYNQSQMNLKEFDDKAKSLRIVNLGSEDVSSGPQYPGSSPQTAGGSYYVILFEKPNFNKQNNGRCAFAITPQSNFSGEDFEQIKTISSIMLFRTEEIHGEVIIYDEIAQKTEKKEYKRELTGEVASSITLTQTIEKEKLDIWNSIAINANATVIINTGEEGVHDGYCRPFEQYSKDGDNLKTTSVYHICYGPRPQGTETKTCVEYLPKRATIFPRQE